jgi:hypothetical protein
MTRHTRFCPRPDRRAWPRLRLDRLEDRCVPATIAWDGGPARTGTDWLDPANWAGDVLPGPADDAVLGGGAVAVLAGPAAVGSAAVAAGATVRVAGGDLTVGGGVTNQGALEVIGGRLSAGGPVVNAPGAGLATAGGGTVLQCSIDNQGTLTIDATTTWVNPGASANTGTVAVSGGDLTLDQTAPGATFGTAGTVTVAAGRAFTIIGGAFTNFTPAAHDEWVNPDSSLTGGTFNLAGSFRFPGARIGALRTDLTLDGPGASVLNSATGGDGLSTVHVNYSRLALRNGGTLTGWLLHNGGTVTVGAGCTLRGLLVNAGTITGSGVIDAPVNNFGTVRPGEPIGRLTVTSGFYNQTSVGVLEVELNGTTPGTQYDQLVVQNDVVPIRPGGLVVSLGYAAAVGDTFVIIDNRGPNPVSGTFAGLPEGATLTVGDQLLLISYVGGTGNDVTLRRVAPPLPRVTAVQVNDGAAQRSRVTALAVTFDTLVTFAGPAADAFALTRTSDGAAVAFTATVALGPGGRTVVTLADFAGAAAEYGSLADGNYTLTVRAGQISTPAGPLDGNGDGTGGDDYTAAGLYRLYGDATGDRAVTGADLDLFKAAFGARAGTAAYRADLDVNADGYLNGTDFNQFRTRFGVALPP